MWKFYQSASSIDNWPQGHSKEVCFIGRSNVGKSSLINALAKNKIARTSNTPGRTQLINFFYQEKKFFVDLPGYGYAKMPKKLHHQMLSMIEEYLQERKQLIKVFVLVDTKVGLTSDDQLIINFLKQAQKDFMIILTKSDKANQSQQHKTVKQVQSLSEDFIIVSAFKGKNIAKLAKIIANCF